VKIAGRCHCGNISFELEARSEVTARACDCTFCVKHGGVWLKPAISMFASAAAR